jgi:hypothetical protein
MLHGGQRPVLSSPSAVLEKDLPARRLEVGGNKVRMEELTNQLLNLSSFIVCFDIPALGSPSAGNTDSQEGSGISSSMPRDVAAEQKQHSITTLLSGALTLYSE